MFTFRLEKVLKHRSDIVQREARKLHQIAAALEKIHKTISDIQAQCAAATMDEGRRAVDSLSLERRDLFSKWIDGQWAFIRMHEERAREVHVALENQRVVLMKAKQDESVLLKLKDRHYAYWLDEENRRERRQMDEAGARLLRYVS